MANCRLESLRQERARERPWQMPLQDSGTTETHGREPRRAQPRAQTLRPTKHHPQHAGNVSRCKKTHQKTLPLPSFTSPEADTRRLQTPPPPGSCRARLFVRSNSRQSRPGTGRAQPTTSDDNSSRQQASLDLARALQPILPICSLHSNSSSACRWAKRTIP